MTTANPYLALADALGALGATLRHHRDLGFTELPLEGSYLLSPEEALRAQEQALAGCRRCRLCEGRTTIVFGSGNPRADFVCIGEGPGADEDAQGLPFVGRAGQLLTKMLASVVPAPQPGPRVPAHGLGRPQARQTGIRPPPNQVG